MMALYLVSTGGIIVALVLGFVVWEMRHALQHGKMWIVIMGVDRKFHWYFKKVDGKQVDVGKAKYTISPQCIIRSGRWNIPTSYYIEGVPAPINFGTLKFDGELTAQDYWEAIKSHVARDIIHAFEISPQQIMLTFAVIVCVVVILSNGVMYFNLNRDSKKLHAPQQAQVENAR